MAGGLDASPARSARSPGSGRSDRATGTPRSSRRDERLPRGETLRESADYVRCYRKGRRAHGSFALLYYAPNPLDHPRLGITASRKVGRAVVRNRLKRRVREIFRRWRGRRSMPPLDLVVHLKPDAAQAPFSALRGEILRQLSVAARRA